MLVLITGLSGSGKSTLAHYFMENPINKWIAYDFDRGKYKIPTFNNKKEQIKQLEWWMSVAKANMTEHGLHTLLFGFWGHPSKLESYPNEDTVLAWLKVDVESSKKRVIKRGTPEIAKERFEDWQVAFTDYLKNGGYKCFDTVNFKIEETAEQIKEWLLSI